MPKQSMTVTVTANVNILALNRMLAESGVYLVWIHNHRITKMARVPQEQLVEEILREQDAQQNLTSE